VRARAIVHEFADGYRRRTPGTASAYQEICARYARALARHRSLECVPYMDFVGVCFVFHTYTANTYKTREKNYSYNDVRMLSACPHRVPCPWPSARAVWGRRIVFVGEFSYPCCSQMSLIRGRSVAAGMSGRASRVCVWSGRYA